MPHGWGGKLHDRLLPYLKSNTPDVLCLQEVVHSPQTNKDWLTYRDGDHILPQRANFFRDVSLALPDHLALFCPAAQGVLWDDEVQVPSQWGLATFVRRTYPMTEQVQGFVHKTYSPFGYGSHPRSRNAHGIKLFDYKGNRSVAILHMHGLRDLKGKMDTPERIIQAQNLVSLTNVLTRERDPLIVCGDFNVEPDSETFAILAEAGLKDLVTTQTTRGTRTSYYKKSNKHADYMLVNEYVNVKQFEVVYSPEVSDHCPLVLEV